MVIPIIRFLHKVFLPPFCMLSPLSSLLVLRALRSGGGEGMSGSSLPAIRVSFRRWLCVSISVCLGQSCHYNQDIDYTGAEAWSPADRRPSVPLQILRWFFFTFLIQFTLLAPALQGLAQLLQEFVPFPLLGCAGTGSLCFVPWWRSCLQDLPVIPRPCPPGCSSISLKPANTSTKPAGLAPSLLSPSTLLLPRGWVLEAAAFQWVTLQVKQGFRAHALLGCPSSPAQSSGPQAVPPPGCAWLRTRLLPQALSWFPAWAVLSPEPWQEQQRPDVH